MNRKYEFNNKMQGLIEQLYQLIKKEEQYILCGIYSGGIFIGEELIKLLQKNNINTKLYYVKLDKGNKYKVSETNLPKKIADNICVIFLDDAIWTGRTKFAVESYIKKHHKNTTYKFATFLDCAGYADYSLY